MSVAKPGAEAEDLRRELERFARDGYFDDAVVQLLLDNVDARDSLAFLESQDRKRAALEARIERAKEQNERISRVLRGRALGWAALAKEARTCGDIVLEQCAAMERILDGEND